MVEAAVPEVSPVDVGGFASAIDKIAQTGVLGALLVASVALGMWVARFLLSKTLAAHESHAATIKSMNENLLEALRANTAAMVASARAQEASNEVISQLAEASRTNTEVVKAVAQTRGVDPPFGSGARGRRHDKE